MARTKRRFSLFGSQLTAVISVTLVLVVCGLIAMLSVSADGMGRDIKGRVGFVMELGDSTTQAQVDSLRQMIKSSPWAASFSYLSPEVILQQEQRAMGDDIMALLEANPYRGEIDVRVRPQWASPDSVQALSQRLAALPQVTAVRAHTQAIATAYNSLHRVTLVLGAVAVILLIIALVLINNTVSLTVYARRFVIHTMRLVGARGSFICRPFVVRGAIAGLMAGVIASGVMILLQAYGTSVEPRLTMWLTPVAMAVICGALVIIGVLVCALASGIAAIRYMRWSHDDLYRR